MSKYEIRRGEFGEYWGLYRDRELIAWWYDWNQQMVIDLNSKEMGKFEHLDYTTATEAHGLLTLNAIKQQLESGEQP